MLPCLYPLGNIKVMYWVVLKWETLKQMPQMPSPSLLLVSLSLNSPCS